MSESETADNPPASTAEPPLADQFMAVLEQRGFFGQVRSLEASLGTLANQLTKLGDATVRRLGDMEELVLHILALESVLATVARHTPIDREAVADEVHRRASALGDGGKGEARVHDIVRAIIAQRDH